MSDSDKADRSAGMGEAWGRLLAVGGAVLRGRLELAGIELAEEVQRWLGVALAGALAALFALLALGSLTALLVVLFWDSWGRWQVLALLCLLYAAIAAYCVSRVRASIRNAAPPFAATRAEFEKDQAAWRARF